MFVNFTMCGGLFQGSYTQHIVRALIRKVGVCSAVNKLFFQAAYVYKKREKHVRYGRKKLENVTTWWFPIIFILI